MVSATPKNAHRIYGLSRVPLYQDIQSVIGYGKFSTSISVPQRTSQASDSVSSSMFFIEAFSEILCGIFLAKGILFALG
jgi:hypothetical protein